MRLEIRACPSVSSSSSRCTTHRPILTCTPLFFFLPSFLSSLFYIFLQQPSVPETALKRRKRDEAWAAKKASAAAEAKANAEKNSKEIFKRAEKYVKEYRDQVSEIFSRGNKSKVVEGLAALGSGRCMGAGGIFSFGSLTVETEEGVARAGGV